VQHGVTGWLVPPHDPAALAARLDQLRADPALGTAMGTAGVRRVRAYFTWDQVAERLASVYAMVRRTPLDDRAAVRTGVTPQPLSGGLGALQ
jgi:glycosyltransferase involved in cell wall biosynthesis